MEKRHDIDRQKDIKPPSVLKALDYNKKNASKKNSIELCLLNKLSIYVIIEYWEKLFKVTYISVLSQQEDTALYLMVAAIDSCQIYSTRVYSCTAAALQKKKILTYQSVNISFSGEPQLRSYRIYYGGSMGNTAKFNKSFLRGSNFDVICFKCDDARCYG